MCGLDSANMNDDQFVYKFPWNSDDVCDSILSVDICYFTV